MSAKHLKIAACLLAAALTFAGCLGQKAKIIGVERVYSIGYEGMPAAHARPGYVILLIELQTSEEISPFGGDLVLKDGAGNSYPGSGLFDGKYIFEAPENANNLTLVVKGDTEIPLP